MFIDFREKGERNINRLPPLHTPSGDRTWNQGMRPDRDQTHKLLLQGTMLQPTEPPGQGKKTYFKLSVFRSDI